MSNDPSEPGNKTLPHSKHEWDSHSLGWVKESIMSVVKLNILVNLSVF